MRRLASAVLIQAVGDLQRGLIGRPSYDDQFQSAKQLLCADNPDLIFWCGLANINAEAVVERSIKMLTAPPIKIIPLTGRKNPTNTQHPDPAEDEDF